MQRPSRVGKRRVFEEAIAAVGLDNLKTIVEIGSIRGVQKTSGGHSTKQWPVSANLWTCDINPKATQLTNKLVNHPSMIALTIDGLKFLKVFPGPIDLLYLDGPFDKFIAYKLAQDKLSTRSVILIDDTDIPETTEAEGVPQVISLASQHGYEVVSFDDCVQTMLFRSEQ